MDNLTLEVLAPYLPYGVRVKTIDGIFTVDGWSNEIGILLDTIFYGANTIPEYKPILRPLSDLTKEIYHNGNKFVPIEVFEITDDHTSYPFEHDSGNIKLIRALESISKNDCEFDINFLPFEVVAMLISWHFDVFGLIKEGLAIDINTLESEACHA